MNKYIKGVVNKNNLQNFCFEIQKDSLFVINSNNGSGKTTLLKCICDILDYDGSITVADKKIKTEDVSFYFSGDEFLEPNMSVRKNCKYFLKKEEMDLDVFKKFNIDDKMDCLVSEMSAGNKQKLKLAITISKRKHYYVLDEPTNYLDEQAICEFVNILLDKKTQGTIIVATNDHYFCELVSDYTCDLMGEI